MLKIITKVNWTALGELTNSGKIFHTDSYCDVHGSNEKFVFLPWKVCEASNSLILQVELLLELEESLPQWILKRMQIDKYEEFPNRKSKLQTRVRHY